ncbi:MAG: hypothetical protein ACPGVC_11335 [Salibacteraceae bacterium]
MIKKQRPFSNVGFPGSGHLNADNKTARLYVEHKISKSKGSQTDGSQEELEFKVNIGLCVTCDHKNNCSLITKNEIIINCEHYE